MASPEPRGRETSLGCHPMRSPLLLFIRGCTVPAVDSLPQRKTPAPAALFRLVKFSSTELED